MTGRTMLTRLGTNRCTSWMAAGVAVIGVGGAAMSVLDSAQDTDPHPDTPCVFYLNYKHPPAHDWRAQLTAGETYRPYELIVVPRTAANPEHFTMSASGVTHIRPSQSSEVRVACARNGASSDGGAPAEHPAEGHAERTATLLGRGRTSTRLQRYTARG